MILDTVLRHVEGDVRLMQKIVREIFLDHVALVTKAYDELRYAECCVQLHDVPEHGL